MLKEKVDILYSLLYTLPTICLRSKSPQTQRPNRAIVRPPKGDFFVQKHRVRFLKTTCCPSLIGWVTQSAGGRDRQSTHVPAVVHRRDESHVCKQHMVKMISRFPNRKFKSIWWMPRFYMAMKDVWGGDTLRGGAYKPLIRRCLNGETQ